MIALALDTALNAATAVVARDGAVVAVRSEPMARGHQEAIALLSQAAMAQAGVAFRDLDRIGVVLGPGSFTGLRVGLAFAKGLALAWKTPLVGLGALEVLAASAPERVIAAMDAGRGALYLQPFIDGQAASDPEQVSLADGLARTAAFDPQALVGSAALLLAEAAPEARVVSRDHPDPADLARLTCSAPNPDGPPQPLYLRAPDAKTLAERGVAR